MAAAIAITRSDLSASELRAAAGKEKNGGAARRTLALALVLEGSDRTTAANPCGMDRRTLRDWVHRYNQDRLCGPAQPRAARGPGEADGGAEGGAGAPWLKPAPTAPCMASCGGGASTCATNGSGASGLSCTSARSAGFWL